MYPDRDSLSNVLRSGYLTARDESMVESGVIEGGKNTASFLFVNEHNNTTTKRQAKKDFQSCPRRETAAGAGKRCR